MKCLNVYKKKVSEVTGGQYYGIYEVCEMLDCPVSSITTILENREIKTSALFGKWTILTQQQVALISEELDAKRKSIFKPSF